MGGLTPPLFFAIKASLRKMAETKQGEQRMMQSKHKQSKHSHQIEHLNLDAKLALKNRKRMHSKQV